MYITELKFNDAYALFLLKHQVGVISCLLIRIYFSKKPLHSIKMITKTLDNASNKL